MSSAAATNPAEPNFKAFSKIVMFMRELKEAFGDDFPEVVKFYQLSKRTKLDNHAVINRQVQVFNDYCEANRAAIQEGKLDALNEQPIAYNEKILFHLKPIVNKADQDAKKVILKFLQLILCLINPQDELKQQLVHQAQEERKSHSKEDDVFASIISKVSERYKDTQPTDLSSALADVQSSGFIDEIASSINNSFDNGDLDLGKLMSSAFGLFNKIKEEASDPQMAGALGMIEGMMQTVKGVYFADGDSSSPSVE